MDSRSEDSKIVTNASERTVEESSLTPFNPEALIDFLDDLKGRGFNIGTTQYILTHDLVLNLLSNSGTNDNVTRFESLLRPILCKTPQQQDSFYLYYDNWKSKIFNGPESEKVQEKEHTNNKTSPNTLDRILKTSLWIQFAIASSVSAGIIFSYYLIERPSQEAELSTPTQPNQIPEEIATIDFNTWLMIGLGCLLIASGYLAWRLWWSQSVKIFFKT